MRVRSAYQGEVGRETTARVKEFDAILKAYQGEVGRETTAGAPGGLHRDVAYQGEVGRTTVETDTDGVEARLPGKASSKSQLYAALIRNRPSTSTQAFRGRDGTPTAARAWRPASPKTSTMRSEAPFITLA